MPGKNRTSIQSGSQKEIGQTGRNLRASDIKTIVQERYGEAALRVTSKKGSCCGGSSILSQKDPITSAA